MCCYKMIYECFIYLANHIKPAGFRITSALLCFLSRSDGCGQGAESAVRRHASVRPEHRLLWTLRVSVQGTEGQEVGGRIPGDPQQPLPHTQHWEVKLKSCQRARGQASASFLGLTFWTWIADPPVNLWTTPSRAWGYLLILARGRRSRRPGCRSDASITWSEKMNWLTCTCRWERFWARELQGTSRNNFLDLKVYFKLAGGGEDGLKNERFSLCHEHLRRGRRRLFQGPQEPDGFTPLLQGMIWLMVYLLYFKTNATSHSYNDIIYTKSRMYQLKNIYIEIEWCFTYWA